MVEAMPRSARRRKAGGKKAGCKKAKRYIAAAVTRKNSLMPLRALAPQEVNPAVASPPEVREFAEQVRRVAEKSFFALLSWMEYPKFCLTLLSYATVDLCYLYLVLRIHGLYEMYVVEPLPFGTMKVVSAALGLLLLAPSFWMIVRYSVAHFESNVKKLK
jgi:hypothetical protein